MISDENKKTYFTNLINYKKIKNILSVLSVKSSQIPDWNAWICKAKIGSLYCKKLYNIKTGVNQIE